MKGISVLKPVDRVVQLASRSVFRTVFFSGSLNRNHKEFIEWLFEN